MSPSSGATHAAGGVQFDLFGDKQASHRLEELADRVEDRRHFETVFVRVALRGGRRRFATRPGWPPLAESTLRQKRKAGQPDTPNVATGRVLAALTVRGAPGQMLKSTSESITFGLEPHGVAFYGEFLNKRRPLIGLSRAEKRELLDGIRFHLIGNR